jgi:hypothetical protein
VKLPQGPILIMKKLIWFHVFFPLHIAFILAFRFIPNFNVALIQCILWIIFMSLSFS